MPIPVSVFTIGVQGPPGAPGNLTFANLPLLTVANTGQALVAGAFYPIDTTGGAVSVQTPAATNGAFFGVSDVKGNASVNPISILAVGVGVTIQNFSNPSSYGSSSVIAAAGGPTVWYAYHATLNAWIAVWW